jgi:O-antigen/teichoic acid export membrane protein
MRRDDAHTLLARLFTYMLLALSSCSLGLVICSRPAFQVMVGPDFQAAVPLIPLIVAAYFIRSIGEFLRCLFLVAGKPGYDAFCNWIGMAVCLAAYFVLIPRYGMWGAALATAITFVVITGISIVWTYRLNRYRVEGVRLVKVGVAAGGVLAVYYLAPVSSLPAQIGWSALLLLMFPCALWLLRFPTPGERQMLRSGVETLVRWRYGLSAG